MKSLADEAVIKFFLSIARIVVPSGAMNTSYYGGITQFASLLISLCPKTKVHGVFSNRVLPTSFSG